jgi:hypothetical protein
MESLSVDIIFWVGFRGADGDMTSVDQTDHAIQSLVVTEAALYVSLLFSIWPPIARIGIIHVVINVTKYYCIDFFTLRKNPGARESWQLSFF